MLMGHLTMLLSAGRNRHLHVNFKRQHVDRTLFKTSLLLCTKGSAITSLHLSHVTEDLLLSWHGPQCKEVHYINIEMLEEYTRRRLCAHIGIQEHQPSLRRLLLCTIGSAITSLHLSHVIVNTYFFHDMDPLFFPPFTTTFLA
jgi:hypothetical protein